MSTERREQPVTAQPGPVVEDPASVVEGPTIPVVDRDEADSSGSAVAQPFSLAHIFCRVFLPSQCGTERNPFPWF